MGNAASLTAKETAIKSRLEGYSYVVTVFDDSLAADSWTPSDYDGIIISQSVVSSLSAWICNDNVGILVYENGNIDECQLATTTGTAITETDIYITNTTHYITETYGEGTLTVSSSSSWIYNTHYANDVLNLAYQNAQPSTRGIILVLENATTGADGNPAPNRRVWWGIGCNTGSDVFNSDGWVLFDKAIEWITFQDVTGETETTGITYLVFAVIVGILAFLGFLLSLAKK